MVHRAPHSRHLCQKDILLNEKLLTGYGKPQWIYAIHFFPHLLSHHTIKEAKARYHITNQDTLAPQFAQYITQQSSATDQDPQPHPAPDESTREPISTPTQQLSTTAHNTPTPPPAPDAPILPAAHTNQHRQRQPTNKPTSTIPNNPPTAPTSTSIPQQPITAHATPPLSTDSDATTPTNAHNNYQQLDPPTTTPNHSLSIHHPMAPTAPSSQSTPSSAQPIPNHTSPTLAPPAQVEYPYGYDEGVGVSTSQLPHAGRGLYGLRPLPEAPHLFAKQGQFICVYATQRYQISATTATLSSSRYLWSTNTGNRRKARALYFDAQEAPHYGKFINDKWNAHSNNCELRWNPATGRVEVYALRDILLNEEFGADYDAPFWYQRHNGLSTLAQAQQVRTYYQQSKLPWYSARSPSGNLTTSPSACPLKVLEHNQPNPLSQPPPHPRSQLPPLHPRAQPQKGMDHPMSTTWTAQPYQGTAWT